MTDYITPTTLEEIKEAYENQTLTVNKYGNWIEPSDTYLGWLITGKLLLEQFRIYQPKPKADINIYESETYKIYYSGNRNKIIMCEKREDNSLGEFYSFVIGQDRDKNCLLEIISKLDKVMTQNQKMKDALKYFTDRVEEGFFRSTFAYQKFKKILEEME